MRKINLTFFIILSFLFTKINSQNLKIDIEKNKKIITTLSYDIKNNISIHFIKFKNKKTKQYGLTPIVVNESNDIIQLEDLIFLQKPYIKSYHISENNLLTLVVQPEENNKNKTLIIDLDLNTKTSKIITIFADKGRNFFFTLADKTFWVNFNAKDNLFLNVYNVINTEDIQNTKLTISQEQKDMFLSIFDSPIDIINRDHYIEYGSINFSQIYYTDNQIDFLHVDKKSGSTNYLTIPIEDPEKYYMKNISVTSINTIKDLNFYLFENKIFYLFYLNNKVFLEVIDMVSEKKLFQKILRECVRNEVDDKKIKKYSRTLYHYNYSPTITVNRTIENNMIVNVGYVNNELYLYNNSWFFQNMMMQQMMQPTNIPRFGPNPHSYTYISSNSDKEKPFQFLLDNDFNIIENGSKTSIFGKIDKQKNIDKLKSIPGTKYMAYDFTDSFVRALYYNINQKAFFLMSFKQK